MRSTVGMKLTRTTPDTVMFPSGVTATSIKLGFTG